MARQGSTDKGSRGEGNSPGEITYHEVIAGERRRLQKARAVLDCLAVGLEYELDIDFADVATVVSALIGDAIANLDSSAIEARRGGLAKQQATTDQPIR